MKKPAPLHCGHTYHIYIHQKPGKRRFVDHYHAYMDALAGILTDPHTTQCWSSAPLAIGVAARRA